MPNRITVRHARRWEEVHESIRGAERAFPRRSPDDQFFEKRVLEAPSLPLHNTMLLYNDGRLASSLQMYERVLEFGGHPVWTAALGNVHTVPEHQGLGFGSRLLSATRETIADRGYAISILKTGKTGFYADHGWEPVGQVRLRCVDPRPIDVDSQGRWLPFRSDDHLEAVRQLYTEETRGVDGRVRRPASYWTDWILCPDKETHSEDDLLVFEEDGEIAGYLVWQQVEGAVTVQEFVYCGSDRFAAVGTAWNRLLQETDGPLRWDPPTQILRAEVGDDVEIESDYSPHLMLQLHDEQHLSQLIGQSISTTEDLITHLTDDDRWYWSTVDQF